MARLLAIKLVNVVILALIFGASYSHAVVPARYLGSEQALNLTIASFTKVINSNRLSESALAERYIERGLEYGRLFRYQRSVADFSKAIALNQSSAKVAYVHRAFAYARLENYDKAFQDFTAVLSGNTQNLSALDLSAIRQRAALHYLRGHYQQAAQDFSLYLRYKPTDMYRMLWMYLAEFYANSGDAELSNSAASLIRQYSEKSDLQQWPGALLQLYMGDIPLDNLLLALKPILSSWDANYRCEVYFYVGQYHLLQGNKVQAIRYFDQAVKTKAKSLIEYEFSVAYLRKLQ